MRHLDFTATDDKPAVFDKLFELMSEFDTVCRKYGLSYFLAYGTLLGAIRHNGFIPWDDDADIVMMRKDYDKLKKLAEEGVFHRPFFFQTPDTDKGSLRFFARLRNSMTTSVSCDDAMLKMNHGIFIDIFPMDYVPNNNTLLKLKIFTVNIIRMLGSGWARYYSGFGAQGRGKKEKLLYSLCIPFYKSGLITTKKMYHLSEKICALCKAEKCGRVASMYEIMYDDSVIYPKEWLTGGETEHTFEQGKFMIPKQYDKILTHNYGDYMTPRKAPAAHGALIQKTDIPYKKYIQENMDLVISEWKKTWTGR